MANQNVKITWLEWKWVLGGFRGLLLQIDTQNSKIQYGGPKCKNSLDGMKIITRGFSKSLIVNLYLKFRNSKWLIEYGRSKCKNLLDRDENYNSGVFEIADYESWLENSKSNMADQNVKKLLDSDENVGTGKSLESLNADWIIKLYDGQFLHSPRSQTFI